ncbi:DUF4870 domain-containing protein [Nesterenkonia alba]|uniref:DUF4870 domain-containing protein n=1 Tax=Nesterenkonia alba TaxID=515814 RepID=UPI0003B57B7D|nr:DUF4870 domain-containing protein [Nesterenkonia alba]
MTEQHGHHGWQGQDPEQSGGYQPSGHPHPGYQQGGYQHGGYQHSGYPQGDYQHGGYQHSSSAPTGDYPFNEAARYADEQPLSPSEEQGWGVGIHLGGLFFSFIVPLVIWLIFRRRSRLIDDHGKTALNWELTLVGVYVVGSILFFISYFGMFAFILGADPGAGGVVAGGMALVWMMLLLAFMAVMTINVVLSILGSVAAYRRKKFKYWAIPFIR